LFSNSESFGHYLGSYIPFWKETKSVLKLDKRIKEDLVGFLKGKFDKFQDMCKMVFIDLGLDKLDQTFFNAEKILINDDNLGVVGGKKKKSKKKKNENGLNLD